MIPRLSRGLALASLVLLTLGTSAPQAPLALESVASPSGPGSAEPNLAVAANGRIYMTWLEPAPDSAYALRIAALTGTTWSAARTIRSGRDFFVNWADFPSVEVLADGRLAAHWLQRNGKGTYAYGVRIAQSRDGGATWSAPVIPHRDSSQTEHGFVALWREGASLGAVWLDGRKFDKTGHGDGHSPLNEMTVVTTTLDAKGRRGTERTLDARACDCCQTSAAMTSSGPIVVYRDRSADEIRDIYVVRRVSGTWTTPAPVHNDGWKIAACPVNGPAVAANGRNVAVAWFTAANDSARVKLAFSSDAGATFGLPIRIDNGNTSGRVDLALLADGSALVSWIERTGGDTAAVRARRVTRNGTPGAVNTIATSSAARASGFPRLAVSKEHVVFAWTVPGKPSQVRVARALISDFR
jgi:hypothetical protein